MIIILRHARAKAYFEETRTIMSKAIRISIQTGLLTTLFAFLLVAISVRETQNTLFTMVGYLQGKSYTMSLLANLNTRIRETRTTTGIDPVYRKGSSSADTGNKSIASNLPLFRKNPRNAGNSSLPVTIGVTSTTERSEHSIRDNSEKGSPGYNESYELQPFSI